MKSAKKKGALGSVFGCCRVDSLLTVDERGQMVLPKKVRERAGIRAGDQLALASWEHEGELYCFLLVKAGKLGGMLQGLLSPLLKGAVKQ